MPARLAAGLLLALAVLPLAAAAQTGEDVLLYTQRTPAVGARMTGLAGAGVAGVADWGAAFANPAGLGYVGRSHAVGALAVTTLDSDARTELGDGEARATRFALGTGAYVAKIPTVRGSLVFGVGYNGTASFERELSYGPRGPQVGTGATEFGDLFEDGQSGELSVAGAVEVAPSVMAGLSLNAVVGSYSYQGLFDASAEPFLEEFLEAELRGFNLRAGLTAEVTPGVRLGTTVETPTVLRVEEAFDFDGRPEAFDYTITTPWRVAGGLVYEAGGWLLAADVEFLDWSQARLRPSDDFREENLDLRRVYREVINTRFGAEYDFGPGMARLGAAFQPDPLRDEVEADRLRTTYTVGFGFRAGPAATVDVAYALTMFDDQYVTPFGTRVGEDVMRHLFLVGARVDL